MPEAEDLPSPSPHAGMLSPAAEASVAAANSSLTPTAVAQAVILSPTAAISASPEVPATVIAKASDAGHIIAEGLTPRLAQSMPVPAQSTPRPAQTIPGPAESTPASTAAAVGSQFLQAVTQSGTPKADTPVGAGVLDSVYGSESEIGNPAFPESAFPSATNGNAAVALAEGASAPVDMIDHVYFAEPDSPPMYVSAVESSEATYSLNKGQASKVLATEIVSFTHPGSEAVSTSAPQTAALTGGSDYLPLKTRLQQT